MTRSLLILATLLAALAAAGCGHVPEPVDCDDGQCDCDDGFEANADATMCIDVDECASGTVECGDNARCDNSEGTYACVCDTGYEGDGQTCANVDECAAGTDACDAVAECQDTEGGYDCICPGGYSADGTECIDHNECFARTHECGENALCKNTPGDYECECNLGFIGDGYACRPPKVLGLDNYSIMWQAAVPLGWEVQTTYNGPDFAAAYDAGGFDVIAWMPVNIGIPSDAEWRFRNWVDGGGHAVVQDTELYSNGPMQAALGVSLVSSYTNQARQVYPDPSSAVDLFGLEVDVPRPLGDGITAQSTGAELLLTGDGTIAGRLDAADGAGAIAITRSDRVVVNSFPLNDFYWVNADGDTVNDIVELYTNELAHLFPRPHILVFDDSDARAAANAARDLGYAYEHTTSTSGFDAAYDSGGFDVIVWQMTDGTLPTATLGRLQEWVADGGYLIFNWWNLDTSPEAQSMLGVSAISYEQWRDVYSDATCPVDILDISSRLDAPLTGSNDADDNGDELTIAGEGYLCGRLDSAMGAGAIAITKTDVVNREQIIVNGFLPTDMGTTDSDADGTPDAEELYTNELLYLLRP
jgi:hypothetical protein